MKPQRQQIKRKDEEYDEIRSFVHLSNKIETKSEDTSCTLNIGNSEEKGQSLFSSPC